MKRTDLSTMSCPIARGLNRVGEWWSILILRDAMHGFTRFDEFQKSLKIAPNILTRRLADLVEAGLLERVQYNDRPPRFEYVLTEVGRDFRPVMLSFVEWGNRNFAPEGRSVQLVERASGRPVRAGLVDLDSGKTITSEEYDLAPGPAANADMRNRFSNAPDKSVDDVGDAKRKRPANKRRRA